MSRPIYEPSLPRADAENAYGNRQLFRRPAPRTADCLPWLRRSYTMTGRPDGALVCGTVNDVVVSYNDTDIPADPDPNSSWVQGSDDWETYFDLYTSFQIQVLQDGHYTLSGKIRWDDQFPVFASYIVLSDGGSFSEIVSYVLPINEITGGNEAFTFTERYPAFQTLQIAVAQGSASSQTLATAYFEIRYDGCYTGPDTNDQNDPDPVE